MKTLQNSKDETMTKRICPKPLKIAKQPINYLHHKTCIVNCKAHLTQMSFLSQEYLILTSILHFGLHWYFFSCCEDFQNMKPFHFCPLEIFYSTCDGCSNPYMLCRQLSIHPLLSTLSSFHCYPLRILHQLHHCCQHELLLWSFITLSTAVSASLIVDELVIGFSTSPS